MISVRLKQVVRPQTDLGNHLQAFFSFSMTSASLSAEPTHTNALEAPEHKASLYLRYNCFYQSLSRRKVTNQRSRVRERRCRRAVHSTAVRSIANYESVWPYLHVQHCL